MTSENNWTSQRYKKSWFWLAQRIYPTHCVYYLFPHISTTLESEQKEQNNRRLYIWRKLYFCVFPSLSDDKLSVAMLRNINSLDKEVIISRWEWNVDWPRGARRRGFITAVTQCYWIIRHWFVVCLWMGTFGIWKTVKRNLLGTFLIVVLFACFSKDAFNHFSNGIAKAFY